MAKTIAHIISIIFHPLLMLTYMLVLLMMINPYLFGVHNVSGNTPLILFVFLSTFIIPGFAVVLMKQIGFIESIQMHDRLERTGPYIITGIFYLWMFKNFLENPNIPSAYTIFVLGSTIGLFLAFFINIFSKISAHAVGMGGLVGMVLISLFKFSYNDFIIDIPIMGLMRCNMNTLLMTVIIIAGVVGSARLVLNAHEPRDLYGGYLIGFVAQFIAFMFIS